MHVDLGTHRQTRLPVSLVPIGCAALLVLGLVRSAVICLRRQPDADMATVPLIDEAVRAHGLSALSAWHYTQDNWLLSVILPELPLQVALAPCPWLPALTGWLFFVGCCAIIGLLARPTIGSRPALLLGTTLLFASPDALTGFGFLAHPTSHDVSSFWCLLALLPAMACLRGRSPLLVLATAAALLVATISDPWTRAAFLLPVSAASLVAAVALGGRMRRVAFLIALATLPSWLCGSHAFGLMPSLTALHFDRGPLSAVPAHLRAALLGAGLLFGIGDPVPSATGVPWGAVSSLLALAALGLLAAVTLISPAGRPREPDGFLMLVCVLSCAGTVAAFGLSAIPADTAFARLVLNLYFVLPLLLCLALAGTRGAGPAALLAAALLFVAGSLDARWMPVREHSVGAPGWQTRLTRFLRAHDLHYGYGGYWGSDANSSRVRTRGAVTIRPVSGPGGGLPIQPTGSQTFDAWYRPGDAGSVQTRFFVSVPDPDLCGDPAACRTLAIRSFGRPDRILDWEGHDILVWSHPVLFRMPDPSVLDALPAPGRTPSSGVALQPYLWTGWTLPDGDGSWMRGQHAVLMLPPVPEADDRQCLLLRAASGPDGGPTQSLRLRDGDTVLASWTVPPGLLTWHCIPRHVRGTALVLEHGPEDAGRSAWVLLASIGAKKDR